MTYGYTGTPTMQVGDESSRPAVTVRTALEALDYIHRVERVLVSTPAIAEEILVALRVGADDAR
jgi:hypothetical protein